MMGYHELLQKKKFLHVGRQLNVSQNSVYLLIFAS